MVNIYVKVIGCWKKNLIKFNVYSIVDMFCVFYYIDIKIGKVIVVDLGN